MKTRKLRKLFTKLQAVKQDISDVTEEYTRDRRDLVSHLLPLFSAFFFSEVSHDWRLS